MAIIATCILSKPARAQNQAIESTVELGATYYHMGKYDAALAEFNTVLASDPQNSTAKSYIASIFNKEITPKESATEEPLPAGQNPEYNLTPSEGNAYAAGIEREQTIPEQGPPPPAETKQTPTTTEKTPEEAKPAGGKEKEGFQVSGEVRTSMGATPSDFIWDQVRSKPERKRLPDSFY